MVQRKSLFGIAATLFGGCLWGVSGAVGQYLFQFHSVSANWLVPYRLLTAGTILLLYYTIKAPKQVFAVWRTNRNAIELLLYAVMGMMMCQYAYFLTIQWSNAGTATVLQYAAPTILMLIVCISSRKFPARSELAAVLCATAGVFFLATHGQFDTLVISPRALIMGLFSAVSCVCYNLLPRKLLQQFPATLILGWGMLIGGFVLLFAAQPWRYPVALNLQICLCFCVIVLLGTIVSFGLYMTGLNRIGPTKACLYACIEPVSASVLSTVWLGDPFAPIDLLGFALILSTVFLLAIPDLRRSKQQCGEISAVSDNCTS